MRPTLATAGIATLVALAFALAGCGGADDETPVACLDGSDAYLAALGDAPGLVTLSGEVAISDCLSENQTAGDLTTVGTSLLEAATQLNAEARKDPGGQANLELGYLLGALASGSESTQGIHTELIRRVAAAAHYSRGDQQPPAVFLDTFQRGYEAGLAHG
jgi:hypothetical protein